MGSCSFQRRDVRERRRRTGSPGWRRPPFAGLVPDPAWVGFGFRKTFQVGERLVPHLLEPPPEQTEILAPRRVVVEPALVAARDETRGFQDGEMLGDGAEADLRTRARDVARGPLAIPHETEDLPPPRRSEGVEDGRGRVANGVCRSGECGHRHSLVLAKMIRKRFAKVA
jgi:hypothetical protein